jgi:hypothetical protein
VVATRRRASSNQHQQKLAGVTFGTEKDVSREFETATAVVDSNTHEQLRTWVKKAEESGRYPGVKFPSIVLVAASAT